MSECTTACLGKEDGHGHITLTRPRFTQYIARVRRPYEKRYTIVKRSRSRSVAYRALAEAMLDSQWRRGDVLGDEGPESYYGPMLLVEMQR